MKKQVYYVKYTRRIIEVLFLVAFLVELSACIDPYSIRATRTSVLDFRESQWMSDEPTIYLEISKGGNAFGYLLDNSERIEIEYAIDWGQIIVIYKKPLNNTVGVDDYIMEGTCVCTKEKVVITVQHDYIFNGKYDKIVLNRVS